MTGYACGPGPLPSALAQLPGIFDRLGWVRQTSPAPTLGLQLRIQRGAEILTVMLHAGSALAPAVILMHPFGRDPAGRDASRAAALTTLAFDGLPGDPPFLWPSLPAHADSELSGHADQPDAHLVTRWDAIRFGDDGARTITPTPTPTPTPVSGLIPIPADDDLADLLPPLFTLDPQFWRELAERVQRSDRDAAWPPCFDLTALRRARAHVAPSPARAVWRRRLGKLLQDPQGYCLDSSWGCLRALGRRWR